MSFVVVCRSAGLGVRGNRGGSALFRIRRIGLRDRTDSEHGPWKGHWNPGNRLSAADKM